MERLARAGAAVAAGLGAYCALGAVAIAPGSTSATRIAALPPAWVFFALLASWTALLSFSRASLARVAPLYGALACVLPFLPGRVPAAFLAWQGLPAACVWVGIASAVLASKPWPPWIRVPPSLARVWIEPRRATAAAGILAAFVAFVAWRGASFWVPGGDEPHYLVITQSLLRDGDLRIENNHEAGDYAEFYGGLLRPDFIKRGVDGQIYSVHAPGISTLVLPAFAIAGYRGVVLFLVASFGLGAALAWRIAWRVSDSVTAAWVAWSASMLSWPVLAQSFEIYPDGVGGVLVLVGVWTLVNAGDGRLGGIVAGGLALAALPWMHTRMALLPVALGAAIALRLMQRPDRWKALAAFSACPAIGAAAWFAFFKVVYGTWNPAAPYGDDYRTDVSLAITGLPGILFDQQYGLLTTAPAFAIAALGAAAMLRHGQQNHTRRLALELAVLCVPYAVAVAAYPMWFGGAAAPARFVASILPTAIIPIAVAWERYRAPSFRAAMLSLVVLSLVLACCAFWLEDGQFAVTQKAPFSPFWKWATRAADLPTALPSVLRGHLPLVFVQASVWFGGLATWTVLLGTLGDRRALRAAAAVPLAVLVTTVGLSASWTAASQGGLAVQASRSALLQVARPGGVGVAIGRQASRAAGGRTVSSIDAVLPAVALERGAAAEAASWVSFGTVPPGRYRLEVDSTTASGRARVSPGGGGSLASIEFIGATTAGSSGVEFELPLPVSNLSVDLGAEGLAARPRLVPLALRRSVAPASVRARDIARYGTVAIFLPSDRQFVEREGLWLRPGSIPMVLQADGSRSAIPIVVRNVPVANVVTVTTEHWQTNVTLAPDEEKRIDVPVPAGSRAVYVEFRVEEGIRPRDLDRASRDTRRLGAWLVFPE